jgi:hypothetical protein
MRFGDGLRSLESMTTDPIVAVEATSAWQHDPGALPSIPMQAHQNWMKALHTHTQHTTSRVAEANRARLVRDLARNSGYWREPMSRISPGQSTFLLVTAFPALRSQRGGQESRSRLTEPSGIAGSRTVLPVRIGVAGRRYALVGKGGSAHMQTIPHFRTKACLCPW